MDVIKEAKQVCEKEMKAIGEMQSYFGAEFLNIVKMLHLCKGKVIITGVGKPGHIGKKIAATLSSLGTKAVFMHPAEALHGDLGMVDENDILIAISWSGESEEVTRLLPALKLRGTAIVGITSNEHSTLAKYSDIVQKLPKVAEADELNLAPTVSTTCELVYGDALAVVLSKLKDFKKEDFGKNHPAGVLGKKLCYKVADLMLVKNQHAVSHFTVNLKDAIIEMSQKASTIVTLIDENSKLCGVITDGDLRRLLEKGINIYNIDAKSVMTITPTYIYQDEEIAKALKILNGKRYSAMPVLDRQDCVVGTITLQDILKQGIREE